MHKGCPSGGICSNRSLTLTRVIGTPADALKCLAARDAVHPRPSRVRGTVPDSRVPRSCRGARPGLTLHVPLATGADPEAALTADQRALIGPNDLLMVVVRPPERAAHPED